MCSDYPARAAAAHIPFDREVGTRRRRGHCALRRNVPAPAREVTAHDLGAAAAQAYNLTANSGGVYTRMS
jgi:hypothetical protein